MHFFTHLYEVLGSLNKILIDRNKFILSYFELRKFKEVFEYEDLKNINQNIEKDFHRIYNESKIKYKEEIDKIKNYFFCKNDNELKNKITEVNNLKNEIEKYIKNLKDNDNLDINNKYYAINIGWLSNFFQFCKNLDTTNIKDIENNFNENISIINNSAIFDLNIENGELIQEENMKTNDIILNAGSCFLLPENIYMKLKKIFNSDYDLVFINTHNDFQYYSIYFFNKTLKQNISSLKKHSIIISNKMTFEEFKTKIISCLKSKYNFILEENNNINVYYNEYKNNQSKRNFLIENFKLLFSYGITENPNMKCKFFEITKENFEKSKNNSNYSNFYIEISENNFIIIDNKDKNNICDFCESKFESSKTFIKCDIDPDCLNKYCSINCLNSDKNHIQYHKIYEKYCIKRITLKELLNSKLKLSSKSQKGKTGLINIGNTCFMNSALQCLSNCYELTKYFLNNYYLNEINYENRLGTGGKIANSYKNLLQELWEGNEKILNPNNFRGIFVHFVKQFSGYAQQDSNEFLIYILDKLHEDLNKVNNKPYIEIEAKKDNETDLEASNRWWNCHKKRENSIIVELFHGQFKSTILCNFCGRISVDFDPYSFLSLPIPSGRYEIKLKYFPYDFKNFFETEILITEHSTVNNAIEILTSNLNIKNKIVSNPNKRKNKKNNKNKNIINNNLDTNCSNIEIVLLDKNKTIYKVLSINEYIFNYIQQGYELVAYEKVKNIKNAYFYLTKYYEPSLWSYFYSQKKKLFDYPIAYSLNDNNNLYSFYEYVNKLLQAFCKNDESMSVNFSFNEVCKDNEKKCGFYIYLNLIRKKKSTSICSSIFSSQTILNYRILEKHSSHINFKTFKHELKLNEKEILIFDIDIHYNINLPKLENNNENYKKILTSSDDIDLYDCLNLFKSEEKLDGDNKWYCNKCKKHREVLKKMDIYKAPYYLIIQIKRFKQDDIYGQRSMFNFFSSNKNKAFINFPTKNLDLSKYILSNTENKKIKYNLIGVINHYGGSSFGHYTAFCLNGNKWYEFNDESVSSIDERDVVTNAAYVLFYKKIEE